MIEWLKEKLGYHHLNANLETLRGRVIEDDIVHQRVETELRGRISQIETQLSNYALTAVDCNLREESTVVVISHLKEGRVYIRSVVFENLLNLEQFVKETENKFSPRPENVWDMPRAYRGGIARRNSR